MARQKDKQWTATGAARFAREARIDTIRFLGTRPARLWEMNHLVNAYGAHLNHLRDHDSAMDVLVGLMGYPRPYPRNWEAIAEMFLADEAATLAQADLYVLAPSMCDVVIAAALTLTLEDLQLITEDDLPALAGVIILPHPLIVRAIGGDLGDIRAFTWRSPVPLPSAATSPRDRPVTRFRLSVYNDSHGPVRPDSYLEFTALCRASGVPLGPFIIDSMRTFPFNRVFSDGARDEFDLYTRRTRDLGERFKELEQARGLDENRVEGDWYVPGSEIDDPDDLFAVKFLYAFWRLCAQRIAASELAPVTHSAQVVADRAGVSADARIVKLRRIERKPTDEEKPIDWQHRWTVRMHKVRQWYPSEEVHKVIYRGPYVKGPEGRDTAKSFMRPGAALACAAGRGRGGGWRRRCWSGLPGAGG